MLALSWKQLAVVAGLCLAVAPLAVDGRRPRAADGPAAEHARLEAAAHEFHERQRANRAIVADLAAGRLSLAHAVGLLLRANEGDESYAAGVRTAHPAPTLEESAARNLIERVDAELEPDPLRRLEASLRLRGEFARMFGRPPADRRDRSVADARP